MLIPPPYKKAIILIEEIETTGHSPLKIITEDNLIYYIKNTRGRSPDFNIINEFICHYLLSIWNIPTPEIAAITVNKDLLIERTFSSNHKAFYYDIITFGSLEQSPVIDMNDFISVNKKPDFNKFIDPGIILKIGLFDIWVENTDRKPTNNNILFKIENNRFEIMAFDHAFTFDSLDYKDLKPPNISNTFNDNILATDFAKGIYEHIKKDVKWTKEIKDYFYFCIDKSQKAFNDIATCVPEELGFIDDLKDHLNLFLFNKERNEQIFTEFLSRFSKP